MNGSLIRCIDCNAVYNEIPLDCAAYHYAEEEAANECYQTEKTGLDDSARTHRGHNKEQLAILENSSYSEGTYSDPLRVTFFSATNGEKTFLIKRWRKNIAEEFCYELVPGKLAITSSVEVQKRDLVKQIHHEIKTPALADEKVSKFIAIVQEQASYVDPEQFRDQLFLSNDAQISYLPLSEEHIASILQKSRNIFTPDEFIKINNFVLNNRECDGVLSLIVKKHGIICPEPASDAQATYEPSCFELFFAL